MNIDCLPPPPPPPLPLSPPLSQLVVRWLEHDCRYQYAEDLLQHVRYGLMESSVLHHLSDGHPLLHASLVEEALDYQRGTFVQPLRQTARTRPRFRSLTLYVAGGRKREVSRVRELRYFNPAGPGGGRVWPVVG